MPVMLRLLLLRANKLTLIVSKSNLLLINIGNKPHDKFETFIDQEQLEKKEYAKYLGIFIDSNLPWKKRIQAI